MGIRRDPRGKRQAADGHDQPLQLYRLHLGALRHPRQDHLHRLPDRGRRTRQLVLYHRPDGHLLRHEISGRRVGLRQHHDPADERGRRVHVRLPHQPGGL